MRILLVEDDEILRSSLTKTLTTQNYAVDAVTDGEMGWDYAQATTYDLILLDVSLPKLDGLSLCRRLRRHRYEGAILLLTAKADSDAKVLGLDAGADDYVVKPCSAQELCARIRALLRRQSPHSTPLLTWGALQLDPSTCAVTCQGQPISLSSKEYGLLELFLRSPQRIFSSSAILERMWNFDDLPGEETVRAHIKRLRRKLKTAGVSDAIETIYGMGYRLRAEENRADEDGLTAESTPSSPPANVPLSPEVALRVALAEVWDEVKGTVLERLAMLQQVVAALPKEKLTEESRHAAEQAAHKLVGSLGMFGASEGSQLARELETWFETASALTRRQQKQALPQLQSLLVALQQALEKLEAPQPETDLPPETAAVALKLPQDAPTLLLVDDDEVWAKSFQAVAWHSHIRIESVTTLETARQHIAKSTPDAILLDLGFPEGPNEGLTLLEEISMRFPKVPVLVFTGKEDFSYRLDAARLGSQAFLPKSVPPAQVLQTVRSVLEQAHATETTVLAVDDDPILLKSLKACLKPWGIQIVGLSDPKAFWQTLTTTMPDLLMLDVSMPEITGIELCQVVRNDRTWNELPILFLTAQQDSETICQIYSAGADDYITKPFHGPELVARIVNRLERNRLLRNLAEIDPLTGLVNRHRSTQDLNRYLGLARRCKQPMCLAVVDVDEFKRINTLYGHAWGDVVLKRVAQLLQLLVRDEDILARWGGTELFVGMYGVTQVAATAKLQDALKLLRQETFQADDGQPFQVTFSAGLAEYPQDGTDLQSLYRSADGALGEAKAAGGNCVKTMSQDS